jgi:hypothetical protein
MLSDKNILIWALLLVIFVACLFWHIRENNQLMRSWQENLGEEPAQWLIRFAWSRTAQVLLALGSLALLIITYDWQLSEARQALDRAIKTNAGQEQKITALIEKSKTMTPAMPLSVPSSTTPPAPNSVEALYNPEETATGKQSSMDSLKKRYEDILVTYFFLKKCGRINPGDYHVIISALSQEMASINAPGRLQHDIVTAAQGSYKEMYERSSCTSSDINTTYSNYATYIDSVSKSFMAQ